MCTYPGVEKGQQGLLRPFIPFSCHLYPERVQGVQGRVEVTPATQPLHTFAQALLIQAG